MARSNTLLLIVLFAILAFIANISHAQKVKQEYTCFGLKSTDKNVCNGKGKCIGPDKCRAYYPGAFKYKGKHACFGIKASDEKVCNGQGICIGTDNCLCNPGYGGDNCVKL